MLLSTLLEGIEVKNVQGDLDLEITSIAYDSRKVMPSSLFVAVSGFATDGHEYINEAVKKGSLAIIVEKEVACPKGITMIRVSSSRNALALLAENYYGHPSLAMLMVGVTGTNGKTTTASLIANILRKRGKVGFIGTTANLIGDKKLSVTHTTPDSLDLQELLGEMLNEKVNYVTMEVSSHALSLDRVLGVNYNVAVFTNLTRDHLDFHHTMEEYCQAKTKLFAGLRENENNLAVINEDDPWSKYFKEATKVEQISYGIKNEAMVRALDIQIKATGVSFMLFDRGEKFEVNLKLTGNFNVYNALAAYCVGRGIGFEPKEIISALEEVEGIDGRFQALNLGQDFAVIVDYAHTPDGLENILKTAREITQGKLITVFGCGGDRDRTKRPMMGEIALNLSDFAIVTSDNPRTEDPLTIIEDILVGVKKVKKESSYKVEPERQMAIEEAINMAKSGDVVIIAGKGHEDYQIIGNVKHHFDDREEAIKCLKKLRANK